MDENYNPFQLVGQIYEDTVFETNEHLVFPVYSLTVTPIPSIALTTSSIFSDDKSQIFTPYSPADSATASSILSAIVTATTNSLFSQSYGSIESSVNLSYLDVSTILRPIVGQTTRPATSSPIDESSLVASPIHTSDTSLDSEVINAPHNSSIISCPLHPVNQWIKSPVRQSRTSVYDSYQIIHPRPESYIHSYRRLHRDPYKANRIYKERLTSADLKLKPQKDRSLGAKFKRLTTHVKTFLRAAFFDNYDDDYYKTKYAASPISQMQYAPCSCEELFYIIKRTGISILKYYKVQGYDIYRNDSNYSKIIN